MKRASELRSLSLILAIAILLWSSSFETCNASRRGKHWRQKRSTAASLSKKKGKNSHHHSGKSGGSNSSPSPAPVPPSPAPIAPAPNPKQPGYGDGYSNILDVLDFGAKGDGATDDTKAFQAAWAAACKVQGSTIVVPSEFIFLVGPISFTGPYCKEDIVFQLDGTIIAPTGAKAWGSGLLWWIEFTKLNGITIRGSGVIDGRGSVWWGISPYEQDPLSTELSTKMPSIKPTALRFYGSFGVTVTGITIQNSPQCHLKFDNCVGVQVYNMTISSPGNSLNTDGIHLQNSKDVNIHSTNLGCGRISSPNPSLS